MSILEKVTMAIQKYHLLPRLIKLLSYLSMLLAVLGTGWIFVLPLSGQYRNTYISENALMPSQAYSFYRESEWNFLRGYRDELIKLKNQTISQRNDLVLSWLSDLGYKTSKNYFKNFDGEIGENMYAILHSPRAESEAMLLSAPWVTSQNEENIDGLALTISLGKYFSRLNIWSKNIILVFPQDSKFASRSWVELYHTELENTGGSIESAVVIEFPSEGDGLDHLELDYNGLNGQLPNLDLINCAVYVGEHEGFKIALQKTVQYESNYLNRLKILLLGIKNLAATGVMSTGCETFSGWNIQAIGLRAVGMEGYDITTFGRVVEGIFRSVNNLLEKFHQSFFYYLMLQPRNFVSIGTYLPSAVLLSFSYGVAALNCFLNNNISHSLLTKNIQSALIIFGVILATSVGFGLILQQQYLQLTEKFTKGLFTFGLTLSILPMLSDINLLFPSLPSNWITNFIGIDKSKRYVLQSWSYLYLTMILVSILVVNFTLAYSIGVLSIPLLLIKIDYAPNLKLNRFRSVVNSVLLLLSNPFTSLLILSYLDSMPIFEVMKHLLSSWTQLQCWTWYIFIFGWYPAWLCILISVI